MFEHIKNKTICIHCQGIGYNKYNNYYIKCVLCKGNIYIDKFIVAKILGTTN